MNRKELKQASKDQLKGNWVWAVLLSFVAWLITYLVSDLMYFINNHNDRVYNYFKFSQGQLTAAQVTDPGTFSSILNFVSAIVAIMIAWGLAYTILTFRDTGNKVNVFSGIFSAFTGNKFTSSFLTSLLTMIFTFLWSLLFFIPGIVKAYAYSMTPYIMKDMYDAGHKMTATEAITESRKLMNGHKTDLFVLDLSFIGWCLLGFITLGIGFLWITPYINQTKANFYRKLAGDKFKQAPAKTEE
ncbi:DUF975 family protein [Lactobacillus agrestimuris]|uniref:DUF975 family protein n=1 Tax=Lactobacillus agrestimuris TaxID=2941328 RepID=UPI0020434EAE|nr:DUF975 family protein [Lactobacillus agrestimuris]